MKPDSSGAQATVLSDRTDNGALTDSPIRRERRTILPSPVPIELPCGTDWLAAQYQPAVVPPEVPAGDIGHHPDQAVLLCNPFGQEAIRCHRAFRIISERFARAGIASVRFDYFGTGDSAGDDGEGSLQRWRQDIALAHSELRRRSGATRVVWVGLRLGATLALEAACESKDPPTLVVLWDPVAEGRQYLAELSNAHAFWTRDRQVVSEALGFLLPTTFRNDVAAIDLPKLFQICKQDVAMLIGARLAGTNLLLQKLQAARPGARCEVTAQTTVWCSNEALGSQWVPTEALDSLTRLLEKPQ